MLYTQILKKHLTRCQPHKTLLFFKLSSYGISKTITKWIQDFLTARKFRVRFNISHSAWSDVTSGIPQVSVLGPILFLLFINDLIECCIQYSKIYLFVDDAKLFRHITQDSDQTELQNGVNALQEWSQKWFLKLNASECMVISFSRNVEKATLIIF